MRATHIQSKSPSAESDLRTRIFYLAVTADGFLATNEEEMRAADRMVAQGLLGRDARQRNHYQLSEESLLDLDKRQRATAGLRAA